MGGGQKRRRGTGAPGQGPSGELEGVTGADGAFLLLCRASGRVYDGMRRDAATGEPALVGVWEDDQVRLLDAGEGGEAGDERPAGAGDAEADAEPAKLTRKQKKAKRRHEAAAAAARGEAAASHGDEAETEVEAAAAPAARPAHPFAADERDHCETSEEAYEDVAALLAALARRRGVPKSELRIYDPYYCNGAVRANLANLGFHTVHNECEDFYAVQQAGAVPEFDVLVTNPPYSADHCQRLLAFVGGPLCAGSGRPAMLLMPNYFADKDFFLEFSRRVPGGVCFVAPKKRYHYWAPKGWRVHKHTHSGPKGERTSPFVSFWYLTLGRQDEAEPLLVAWKKAARKKAAQGGRAPVLARSRRELPAAVRDGFRGDFGGGGGGGSGAGGKKKKHRATAGR